MAFEHDPRRISQRQKQVDYGFATQGYANYAAWLESNKDNVKPIPIPDPRAPSSKRQWDLKVRHWRRLLHLWDNVRAPTGTAQDLTFRDPCADVDVEYHGEAEEDPYETGAAYQDATARWDPPPRPQYPPPQWQYPTPAGPMYGQYQYQTPYEQMYAQSQVHRGVFMESEANDWSIRYAPNVAVPYGAGQYLNVAQTPGLQAPWLAPVPTQTAYGPQYQQPPAPRWSTGPHPPRRSWNVRPDRPTSSRPLPQLTGPTQHVVDEEAAGRSSIVAAESAAVQGLILEQHASAVAAASVAQRLLGRGADSVLPPPFWPPTDFRTLLSDSFEAPEPPTGSGIGLPPSLADPGPHPSSPSVDLLLEVHRYSNFHRHFSGAVAADTPRPSWSPHRDPPSSSSPGLTPSPADWSAAQRSPGPVSPRAVLAFDWTPTADFGSGQLPGGQGQE